MWEQHCYDSVQRITGWPSTPPISWGGTFRKPRLLPPHRRPGPGGRDGELRTSSSRSTHAAAQGLLPPHEEALPEDEAALHGHRLRDGADLQAAGPAHAMADTNLNGATPERDLSALSAAARAKAIKVMGQLGKLGDETFPARILEYVGLRSKMYSILTVQPDGARKEKRKIKGVPKKAVRPASRVPGGAGGRQRAQGGLRAAAQPRARDRRGDRREEVALAPQRQGLRPRRSAAGTLAQPGAAANAGAYAPPGSAPFNLVMEFLVGPPPLGPAPTLPLRLSRCWA